MSLREPPLRYTQGMSLDDTHPESLRVQGEVLRGLTGPERLRAACELMALAYEVTRAGLRDRFPDASEDQLDEEHYRLVFGSEVARKVLDHRRQISASRGDAA